MRRCLGALVIGLVMVMAGAGLAAQTAPSTTPRIEQRAGEPVLALPIAMVQALRALDPAFTVRRLIDYPAYMWRTGCDWSPECSRLLYRLNPREAPFAVVGDFNGDGVLDAVMDGDGAGRGRRIALLSVTASYTATEVAQLGRTPEGIASSRADGGASRDWESGLDYGLSLAAPGVYRSPYEPVPLDLKTDGFIVSFFERAAVLYYLRDGQWREFILSD